MIIELATTNDVIRIADMYSRLYSHVYKKPDNVRKKEKLIKYVEARLKREDYFIYKAILRNAVAECLLTMGQMGSLNIKAHPETMFGKTFGETITGKAIEHSQSCECTIWFGSAN